MVGGVFSSSDIVCYQNQELGRVQRGIRVEGEEPGLIYIYVLDQNSLTRNGLTFQLIAKLGTQSILFQIRHARARRTYVLGIRKFSRVYIYIHMHHMD